MDMIERVACAIYGENCLHGLGEDTTSRMRDKARQAIAALREPSDAMLSAGFVHDDATYSTWIAMIDAALVEGE